MVGSMDVERKVKPIKEKILTRRVVTVSRTKKVVPHIMSKETAW
jgi:hypothetical protein